MSIPLNNIVNIKPSVLGVGNNGNNLFGLMLTDTTGLAAGHISAFTSADQVRKLFGDESTEYSLASVYFSGFTNSDRVAAQLYIAPYYKNVPVSLIGGSLGNMTLDELRSLSGDITVTVDKTIYGPETIDLGDVTSFSDAASKINVALFGKKSSKNASSTSTSGSAVASVTFSVMSSSMVISHELSKNEQSGSVKDAIKISASGALAKALYLTTETGAQASISEDISTITKLLDRLRQQNLSFCSVFLTWHADINEKLEFAKWANSTQDDVCVILNDQNPEAYKKDSKTAFAKVVKDNNYEGVVSVYNNLELCAFIAGYPAAWDLTKSDGRFTAAFRRNSLLKANITDEEQANNLRDNGYNFYGVWASSTSNFTFMYEGKISGQYVWLDSWFCQVWMRRQFQYYFIMTLLARGQIPYNTDGKGILTTAIKPAIDQYLSFGAIRPGITLADEQVQQLKQAGLNQSQINNITTVGYYLKVDMERVTPQTRVQRGSPPINFWYTDGQSVQQINMNSIEIQ